MLNFKSTAQLTQINRPLRREQRFSTGGSFVVPVAAATVALAISRRCKDKKKKCATETCSEGHESGQGLDVSPLKQEP